MNNAAALPPLREEVLLHRAPDRHDGSPAWVLEDPGRNLFFQVGWLEAEMLACWHLAGAEAIAGDISARTTLSVTTETVERFGKFLAANSLVRDSGMVERLLRERRQRTQQPLGKFLLRNYLFFRIPLLQPDAFLRRTLPWVDRVFFSRAFALLTIAAAVTGLFLVTRQWDNFKNTFLHFFTLEGAALAAVTLGFTKILHEMGHAYTARRFGCPVSSMGLAFMVMMPLLYTDTSGVWRLRKKGMRLLVCAAGMLAELSVAAWATLLWSFLPDGPFRSAAFMLATTTWILTLAVNLSPFMRFDGYFLLSDTLNVPNLQTRAFALAKWKIRQWLFAFTDPPPETFEPWRERVLVAYAFGTWIYRFFLFMGIALIVYHMFFKALGIALFCVEMGVFIALPVYKEIKEWFVRLRSDGFSRRAVLVVSTAVFLFGMAFVPLSASVRAPALLQAAQQVRLLAPVGAQLVSIETTDGQEVRQGSLLFQLRSPELQHEIERLRQQLAILQWRLSFLFILRKTAGDVPVAQQEQQAALQRLAMLEAQERQLAISAPFEGRMVEMARPLEKGEWVGAGEWLGTLAQPAGLQVVAYVNERDLHRLRVGDAARFVPEDPGLPSIPLEVTYLARTASRHLTSAPELASPNGGAIAAVRASEAAAATLGADGSVWVPEQGEYRVLLRAAEGWQQVMGDVRPQVLRGTAVIEGERQSAAGRLGQHALAVFMRETGF